MSNSVVVNPAAFTLEPNFVGRIAQSVAESEPSWPDPERPAADTPNVVVILLDDVGYSHLGCYGSSIKTPAMDSLAAEGLQFTNFHATALCSPTRASLLTGRNHHAVGMGFLSAFDTGFPGYRGTVTAAAATLAEILGEAGVGCYAAGKWHLAPTPHLTPAGPFHHWPLGRGFDRYYGFLLGEDDQYTPELWQDNQRVEKQPEPGYHLSEDLVDKTQRFIADHVSADPDRPFLAYLAFGAAHAPHQAPRPYIDAYKGAFDHGWDEERRRVLERQIELGVVPPDTELPDPNAGVRQWDDLNNDEQRLAARMNEVFAGFMTHTDDQIQRLLDFLRQNDLEDNTIVVLMSDNGASGEGGDLGQANEYRYFLQLEESFEEALAAIDDLGGPSTHNHFPSGWAMAGNTPLKLYKKHTFGGGVRVPFIVRWPEGITERGGLRTQFHHVTDVAPTLLEVVGVEAPAVHRGVEQMPIHGVSMRYALDDADAPTRKQTQYFETAGHRGLVHDGWKIVANHTPGEPFENDAWELYDLSSDFNELTNLAEKLPEKASEMAARWRSEAEANNVFPLDDRMQTRAQAYQGALRRTHYHLLPGARSSRGHTGPYAGPHFGNREFAATAHLDPELERGQGVLLAYGRRAAGFVLYVKDDALVFDLNLAGKHVVVRSPTLAQGVKELGVRLESVADGAWLVLVVDGVEVAREHSPTLVPVGLGVFPTQVGHNAPSAVCADIDPPFTFGPALRHLDIEIGNPPAGVDPELAPAVNGSD